MKYELDRAESHSCGTRSHAIPADQEETFGKLRRGLGCSGFCWACTELPDDHMTQATIANMTAQWGNRR